MAYILFQYHNYFHLCKTKSIKKVGCHFKVTLLPEIKFTCSSSSQLGENEADSIDDHSEQNNEYAEAGMAARGAAGPVCDDGAHSVGRAELTCERAGGLGIRNIQRSIYYKRICQNIAGEKIMSNE